MEWLSIVATANPVRINAHRVRMPPAPVEGQGRC